ncbi:MAG: DUF1385 domain-containing protein [Ruminococcaceae bacterium]|nr:DUF1385 domain-containing protein [Oscillospiraceae bacterium]
MSKKETQPCCEKFKTSIGGQALIEGIMMRGPEKDAIAVRTDGEIKLEVNPRKPRKKGSVSTWPLIRGAVNFLDSQIVGVKALMRSADLSPEGVEDENPSKFDQWLEKKLGNESFQKAIIGVTVFISLSFSVLLFILLPDILVGFFDRFLPANPLVHNLLAGVVRIGIFMLYMFLVSRMKDMKRVFAYHGAEHKTIRCYEAGLPLTVENVRIQTRLHPRCGTSFLLVVMVISILVFSVASSLLNQWSWLAALNGTFLYRILMMVCKLLLLPLVVAITYEINRWAGRHDNWFTRILTAPGMWLQNWTTNEPDDSMIEIGIAAVQAVLPEEEGADRW